MLRALAFFLTIISLYVLALSKGPLYGLIAYAAVYFLPPASQINWWAEYLPAARWSLISSAVLIFSFVFHQDQLVNRKFRSANWLFAFTFLSIIIAMTVAVDETDGYEYSWQLITYCITVWFIVRALKKQNHLQTFMMSIIVLCGTLSFLAFLEGERIHARLEGIGASDAFESNEFALLITGILPLLLPFIFRGKKHEKIICLLLLPFMLNAFILCNSRGAAIAIFVGFLYSTITTADKVLKKKILLAAICTFPLFLYLMDPHYISRITTLWTTEEVLQGGDSLNKLSSGRMEIWAYGLKMVEDHPFGAGPNGFRSLARYYMPPEMLAFKLGAEYGTRAAHNTYLQILVEQGYIGLIIWITLCLHTLLLMIKSFSKLKTHEKTGTFMGYTIYALNASFVCSLIGGLALSRLYYEFFWWQVALAVVAFSLINEDGIPPPKVHHVEQR